LVAYRLALAVAAGELFSWQGALSYFVIVCVGGLAIGCIVGWLVMQVHERLDDPVIETVCMLMTAYAAYLLSESIHFWDDRDSGNIASILSSRVRNRWGRSVRNEQDIDARLALLAEASVFLKM
jgi:CPA1 family monovalent cation:H+ antiporter